MQNINQITPENFDQSFDIVDILTGSVFYPASGIDGYAIECLRHKSNSFVHVDYSLKRNVVEEAMAHDFQKLGYRTIGLKLVSTDGLKTNGFRPSHFQLNEHEMDRLQTDFIRDKFQFRNFTPFALWAVYELDATQTGSIKGKLEKFSLLHIGGEACATFDVLYLRNRINPIGVVILYAGEGYGDNWTLFTDTTFRFYQSLERNHQQYGTPMPLYLLTHDVATENIDWQNYKFMQRYYFFDPSNSKPSNYVHLFERNE